MRARVGETGRHFLLGKEEKGVGDIDSGGSVALQEEDVHDRGAELVVFLDLDADVVVERFELFDEVNPLSRLPLSVKLPDLGGMTSMRELPGPMNWVISRSTAVLSAL